jgi:hypothetical protein
MQSEATDNRRKWVLVAIVGGIIAIVGTLLDWVTLGGTGLPEEQTEPGTEASAGMGTLGLSLIAIVLMVIALIRLKRSAGRGLAIAAFVLALIALFASAYSAFAPEDAVQQFEKSDIADMAGVSEAEAEVAIEQAFNEGRLEASAEIGSYVATAGVVLLTIGSLLSIMAAGRARAASAGSAATGGVTAPPPGAAGPGPAIPGTGPRTTDQVPEGGAPPPGTPPGGPTPPPN